MDSLIWLRQATLFVHVLAFALALSAVWRADLALLRSRHVDFARLQGSARGLVWTLAVLWASGLLLIGLQVGSDIAALWANPKLVAKLLVVSALTVNGLALHALAWPALHRRSGVQPLVSTVSNLPLTPVVLGAISSASWLAATFIGVSRLVAPTLQLVDFLVLYLALVVGAVVVAMAVFKPRFATRVGRFASMHRTEP
jgi:hypothetical protein